MLAVCCTLQLLQQEDNGVVDNTEHSRAARASQGKLLQVEVCTGFKDTVDHCPPGDCSMRGFRSSLKLHTLNLLSFFLCISKALLQTKPQSHGLTLYAAGFDSETVITGDFKTQVGLVHICPFPVFGSKTIFFGAKPCE